MTAMSFTEMTPQDLMLIQQLRSDRLRSFFAQKLMYCSLHQQPPRVLKICCSEAWIIDILFSDLDELCDYAWLILGAQEIALYFAQEEICRIKHCGLQRVNYPHP
jgi:hypothetical protein